MFSSFLFLIVSLLSSLDVFQVSGFDCATRESVLTPSRLVVKYGDPASATCEVCQPQDPQGSTFSFEKQLGDVVRNETTAIWKVQEMNRWDLTTFCFYEINRSQELITLPVIVYQPPQDVSFSFVNYTEPMTECREYTLQCSVFNVAPAEHLVVTFYRGETPLDHQRSSSGDKSPVTETFSLSRNISKEDDGVEFWCEAKLELGPEGPQRPPVVRSGRFTAAVLYAPRLLVAVSPDPIQIEIAEGETLNLNCSAEGNPAPSYTWMHLSATVFNSGSVYTVPTVGSDDAGEYSCTVKNTVGSVEVKFNVTVKVMPIWLIIVGVVAGFLLLSAALIVFIVYYKHHRMGHYSLKDVILFRKHHIPVPVKD